MNYWQYVDKHPWLALSWWAPAFALALYSTEVARIWGEVLRTAVLKRVLRSASAPAFASDPKVDAFVKAASDLTARVAEVSAVLRDSSPVKGRD